MLRIESQPDVHWFVERCIHNVSNLCNFKPKCGSQHPHHGELGIIEALLATASNAPKITVDEFFNVLLRLEIATLLTRCVIDQVHDQYARSDLSKKALLIDQQIDRARQCVVAMVSSQQFDYCKAPQPVAALEFTGLRKQS